MEKYLKSYESVNDALFLMEMIVIMDQSKSINNLDEGVVDSVKDFSNKILNIFNNKIVKPVTKTTGMHIDNSKRGILQYLVSMGTNTSKLLYHAVNGYYNNNEESKRKVKEISKSVKKEDVIDFLLKLDTLTLHWFTGPIHMLDALTGTHIWANVESKSKNISDKAKSAIETLEALKNSLEDKFKTQIQKYVNALRRVFGIGDFNKINEETITPDIAEPDIKIGDTVQRRLKKNKCKQKRRRRRDGSCDKSE